MINIFYCLIFMTITFSFYFTSTSINKVNRALLYLPLEILQRNVHLLDYENADSIYFEKSQLKNDLDTYFENAISKYVVSYDLECFFFDKNDDFCSTTGCTKLKVNLDATLYFNVHYSKAMNYVIGES